MSSSASRRLYGLFEAAGATNSVSKLKNQKPNLQPKTTKPKRIIAINTSPPDSSGASEEEILKNRVESFKKASESHTFRIYKSSAYHRIVCRLHYSRKFSHIEDIIEDQKKYASIHNEGFTVRLIGLYGVAGMYDHARKLFDEMPQLNCQRTVMSFNALLSACVNSGKFDKLGELLSELPEKLSIELNVVSYNTVVKAFCKMGSFDSAFSVIEDMQKKGLEPDLITFNTLLEAFYRNNMFSDAEKVWKLMEDKNVGPTVRSFNPKLRALIANNRIPEAVELTVEMGNRGVEPDVFSFNSLIKGFCDGGNMEEAKRLYNEMIRRNCNPDKVTYTMLGDFSCEKADFDFALQLCKDAISRKCVLPLGKMQKVVDLLVGGSKTEEARELVKLGNSNLNKYYHYNLRIPENN